MTNSSAPLPSLRDLGYLLDTEAAEIIRKKPQTLRNWRAKSIGPPYTKVDGDLIVYPLEGLKKWLSDRTVKPQSPNTLVTGSNARSRPTRIRQPEAR